jgi:pimeloyl-ACP methyl ester carboxylesterase
VPKKILNGVVALVCLALVVGGLTLWRRPVAVFKCVNRGTLVLAGFQKVHVDSPVGRQTVFEAGQGRTLVFLHGAGNNAGVWSRTAPQVLKWKRYHIVIPDLPGHADSAPSQGILRYETLRDGVAAVLAAKGGREPMILVGNSLGAWIAVLYAHAHPERVARVVAVNGGPLRGPLPNLTPANRREAWDLFDRMLDRGTPRPPGFILDDVIRLAREGPIGRLYAAAREVRSWEEYRLEGRMSEVRTPVDLVWGESDRLYPPDYPRLMQAELPGVRVTTIPQCGHIPAQECPAAFNAVLEKILAEPPPAPKEGKS